MNKLVRIVPFQLTPLTRMGHNLASSESYPTQTSHDSYEWGFKRSNGFVCYFTYKNQKKENKKEKLTRRPSHASCSPCCCCHAMLPDDALTLPPILDTPPLPSVSRHFLLLLSSLYLRTRLLGGFLGLISSCFFGTFIMFFS